MFRAQRYPRINIRSKNELGKRISPNKLQFPKTLQLINDALSNFDKQWYDSERSEPEKGKFVRSAVGTSLGKLLKLIDRKILAPYDSLIPDFIFGGLSGKSHIQAGSYLLGNRRERTLLRLDVFRFFEQIREQRVFNFFYAKCGCSQKAARLISGLCCVPLGQKGSGCTQKSLARGFATSPRLSIWCNLDIFLRLSWMVKKQLRNHDPKIAVYIDDIGITASRVKKEQIEKVALLAVKILTDFDSNQSLPINPEKKEILSGAGKMKHLGLKLGRNKLSIGNKAFSKLLEVRRKLKSSVSKRERSRLVKKYKSYKKYKHQVMRAK